MTLVIGLNDINTIIGYSKLNGFDIAALTDYKEEDIGIVGFEAIGDPGVIQIKLINISEVGKTKYVADKGGVFRIIDTAEVADYGSRGRTTTSFVYRELDRVEQSFGKDVTSKDGGNLPIYSTTATSDRTIPLEQDRYDALINSTEYYGEILKVLPCHFLANNDAAGYIVYDSTGDDKGVSVTAATQELFAFIEIPKGKKATHVKMFGNSNDVFYAYEGSIESGTLGSSLGTAATGVETDITDLPATQSNFLVIKVDVDATADIVYGGYVKISNI